MKRIRFFLCMLLYGILLGFLSLKGHTVETPNYTTLVYPGIDGTLIYTPDENGNSIPDFSHAGYMGGGVALPDVPVKQTVSPSGGADDTGLIQAAIDDVSSLPLENGFRGAVLLTVQRQPIWQSHSLIAKV